MEKNRPLSMPVIHDGANNDLLLLMPLHGGLNIGIGDPGGASPPNPPFLDNRRN